MTYLILLLWLACSILTFGYWYGHFQRKWPTIARQDEVTDFRAGILFALGGPVTLFVLFIFDALKEGLQFRRTNKIR